MNGARRLVAGILGAALTTAAVVILVVLLRFDREGDPGEDIANSDSSGEPSVADVWIYVEYPWRELTDGRICVYAPDPVGCGDPASATDASPRFHFEVETDEGQRVEVAYARATDEGPSEAERVVVADIPSSDFSETGAMGVMLSDPAPDSYEALAADPASYQASTWVISPLINQAFLNELRPPSDGHTPADVYFPTHAQLGGPAGGPWHGVLAERRRCLFYEDPDDQRLLILWPPGYRAVEIEGRIRVLDPMGEVFATVDEPISMGGGAISPPNGGEPDWEVFERLAGELPPPRCREHHAFMFTFPN